jgi:serine/threonine protein kinase
VSGEPSSVGLDATLRDFSGGQKVFNRYTLIKTLGRGGMGIVWLAHDEVLDRGRLEPLRGNRLTIYSTGLGKQRIASP